MADFPILGGGISAISAGDDPANLRGTAITANASANTAGAWVVVLTAANNTEISEECVICLTTKSSTIGRHLTSVGIGTAPNEVVIIPNLYSVVAATNGDGYNYYQFPVIIPKGVDVSIRTQSDTANSVVYAHIVRIPKGTTGSTPATKVTAYGVDTATTGGQIVTTTTAGTFGSWQQIVASTSDRIKGFVVGSFRDNTSWSQGSGMYEVGVGGATPETIFTGQGWATTGAETGSGFVSPYIPVNIATSQEIRIRAVSSITNTDMDNDYIIYGVS
jgi:hypothetical protein